MGQIRGMLRTSVICHVKSIMFSGHPFRQYTVLPCSPLFGRSNKLNVLPSRVYLLVHPRSPELKALTVVFSAGLEDDFPKENVGWKAQTSRLGIQVSIAGRTAPVSHQKRPRQNATNAIELKRKRSKINEPDRYSAAHNGLAAGSSLADRPMKSVACRALFGRSGTAAPETSPARFISAYVHRSARLNRHRQVRYPPLRRA
jgi:hypothetical protein